MRVKWLALVGLLTLGCSGELVGPPIDLSSAQRIDVEPEYVVWWNELERCSGLRGLVSDVKFYRVPSAEIRVDGESYWGYWLKQGNVIALAAPWAADEKLVKHEEMHALLQRGDHPPEYFKGACGDLN